MLDERGLYEKLCLECLQSGLSWALILRKRDGIRDAFAGFDPDVVAGFGARDLKRLLGDARVIRNRQKLEAIIRNAEATVAMRDETPLPELVWRFRRPYRARPAQLSRTWPRSRPSRRSSPRSSSAAAFAFVGPTTVYSTMQAVGVVNDHLAGCFVRGRASEKARKSVENAARR